MPDWIVRWLRNRGGFEIVKNAVKINLVINLAPTLRHRRQLGLPVGIKLPPFHTDIRHGLRVGEAALQLAPGHLTFRFGGLVNDSFVVGSAFQTHACTLCCGIELRPQNM